MCVPERFVFHGSTPAVWPKGGTLSSAGWPCVSPSIRLRTGSASGPALLRLAFLPSHEARRGVSGFGAFCRNKRPVLSQVEGASPAGAKPGHTEQHVATRVGDTRASCSPASDCLPVTPKKNSRYPTSSCQARTIHAECSRLIPRQDKCLGRSGRGQTRPRHSSPKARAGQPWPSDGPHDGSTDRLLGSSHHLCLDQIQVNIADHGGKIRVDFHDPRPCTAPRNKGPSRPCA